MSASRELALVAATVLLGYGVVTVARAARGWAQQRHVRKVGHAVTGGVTGIDPKYRAYYGLYQLTPRRPLPLRRQGTRVARGQ